MISINNKQYIIGLGTGRCGSKSLAYLLNHQDNVSFYHEMQDDYCIRHTGDKILPWYPDYRKATLKVKSLRLISGSIVGDIAPYYLNYVYFMIDKLKNVKFIVMERDKESVVKSYIAKTPLKNHWCSYDSDCWQSDRYRKDRWDKAYPNIDYAKSKAEAIGIYWDIYKLRINAYKKEFPDKFLVINVYDLNSRETQNKIFDYIGLESHNRVYMNVHENAILNKPK